MPSLKNSVLCFIIISISGSKHVEINTKLKNSIFMDQYTLV